MLDLKVKQYCVKDVFGARPATPRASQSAVTAVTLAIVRAQALNDD